MFTQITQIKQITHNIILNLFEYLKYVKNINVVDMKNIEIINHKMNKFVHLLGSFFKFPLTDYLIGYNNYSNHNKDFINLVMINKKVNMSLKEIYIIRGIFTFPQIFKFNKQQQKLINNVQFNHNDIDKLIQCTGRTIILDDDIFFKKILLHNAPNIKKLEITNCFLSYNERLYPVGQTQNCFNNMLYPEIPSSLLELNLAQQSHCTFEAKNLPSNLIKLIWNSVNCINIGELPESLTDLDFGIKCKKQLLLPGILPQKLLKLKTNIVNAPLSVNSLPSSLIELEFGFVFRQELVFGILPANITKLNLGGVNQKLTSCILPSNLINLNLGNNKILTQNLLSASLTTLNLGHNFNQTLHPNLLPADLTKLYFGDSYNKTINLGTLPNKLIKIYFGHEFNQPFVSGSIPHSIQKLKFGINYNQPLIDINQETILPSNLIFLQLGHHFNQSFANDKNICLLPKGVKTILFQLYMVGCGHPQDNTTVNRLTNLKFGRHRNHIKHIVTTVHHNMITGRNNEITINLHY